MARGDKNYSEVTHKASKKGTKERIKAVHDMVGYKKKLHEMVEALISGDSKTAAAALHEYLQTKTRVILGEMDMEGEEGHMDMDDEFGGEEHSEHGDEFGDEEFDGEDHEDHEEGECPECQCDPCECEDKEHDEFGDEDEDHDDLDLGDDEEHGEDHEFSMREGVKNFPKGGSFGNKSSSSGTKKTRMHKFGNNAKDLAPSAKKKNNFEKTSASGSKRNASSGGKTTSIHKMGNNAPGLEPKAKGTLNFEKSSGVGTKSDSSGERKTSMHKLPGEAPGLERRVKGENKF